MMLMSIVSIQSSIKTNNIKASMEHFLDSTKMVCAGFFFGFNLCTVLMVVAMLVTMVNLIKEI